jgi:hypothetical protein
VRIGVETCNALDTIAANLDRDRWVLTLWGSKKSATFALFPGFSLSQSQPSEIFQLPYPPTLAPSLTPQHQPSPSHPRAIDKTEVFDT